MKNSFPLFIVKDIQPISKYLQEKFGYTAIFEEDWYIQLENEGQELGLMIENSKNQPQFLHKPFNGTGVVLTIEVENVDEFYKNFEKDEIIYKLKTEDFGQRHFIIKAPQGIIIDVIEYISPDEYKS
jgi:uncharacterized glyoxalase superfamily protein PhnB